MAEPFIGHVAAFGFNFAPVNWALCNGQLLPISQFGALFTLLGTSYGGDGVNTFAVPDLQGRVPINQGQGPGRSPYALGQRSGNESVTLQTVQIPVHTHTVATSNAPGTTNIASSSAYLSNEGPGTPVVTTYTPGVPATQTALSPSTISQSGGSLPHENRQPFLAVNYCICLFGIFPSQN